MYLPVHISYRYAYAIFSGSFIHSWMLKAYPELITRSCFIDPVVFCSWEGGMYIFLSNAVCIDVNACIDLCYNFIYRRPTDVR